MNKFLLLFLVVLLAVSGFGQKPQRPAAKQTTAVKKPVPKPKPVPTATPVPADPAAEKSKLEETLALKTAAERVLALRKFIRDFPASEQRPRAAESLVTARAMLGDEKLQANENSEGIALFKLAVAEAPAPIPERLFNEIVSKFPANLFFRDHRAAGIEIAEAIEKKAAGNPKQLLSLAAFYLGIESGSDAKRLAEAAIGSDPNSVTAYQTLGFAHRLNFDLEESAKAYSKALELDPGSLPSKRSLAEMMRALGKPAEAETLYREILAANETDPAARTGLILSLFGAGKRSEAESEMAKSLEQNPKNLNLLVGAAYWYAANDANDKAVEFAQKAIDIEPRYVWGHIALARGLMGQRKPVEAESVLVTARYYGNFPTLDYEIASARLMAGFYREAVEELQKSFVAKDGLIQTRLGGRVVRGENSFANLIAYERRASTFEPLAADNPETAVKLTLLFEIFQKLAAEVPDETEIADLADEFVKGDDKMKLHRQMYAATVLLQKNIALPKVLELVKAAVGNTDAGLEVSTPAAAVMASELYESRTIAFARNEIIVVPEVPRQTLSAILRGRIEELTGWTFYQQKNYAEAVVRLRRAISVLPDKSAWWRSSMWRLGAALEAGGKDKEALDSYIKSYKTDRPSALKYGVVNALYKKVHGGTDGLDAMIGPNPLPAVVAAVPAKSPEINAKLAETPTKILTKPAVTVQNASSSEEKTEKTPVVEVPVRIAENVQPVDDAVTADKRTEAKTAVPEPAVRTVETTLAKTENASTAEKQGEPNKQAVEPSVKAAETAVQKVENTPSSDQNSDTQTQVSEKSAKPIETSQPKVQDVISPKKQGDPRTQAAEVPAKAADENRPKVENTPVVVENAEIKISASETPKPETSLPVSPVAPTLKNTETDRQTQAVTVSTASPIIEKPVEKVETSSPQPAQNKEVPAKTDLGPDEPKNLLRNPFPDAEPQPKVEPPIEKAIQPEALEKTDIRTEQQSADEPPAARPKPVGKPVVVVSDPVGSERKNENTKNLFEPVIINVPSSSPPRSAKKETEKPTGLAKGETGKDAETPEKPVEDSVSSGASRRRVVDGKEIKSDTQCALELDQEAISLINGGGSLGILASITGEGDFKDIVATSSSPKDVEVRAEPEIEGISGRRFYVIKSVSTAVGVYQVTFESRCGKREIIVKVR